MAYQIKKSQRITEDLELLGDDNSVALTIHVDIDVDRIARDYRMAMLHLTETQKAAKNGDPEALTQYGEAIVQAYELVFGVENTQRLLAYFDGKATDMVLQTMPFLYDVIEPAVYKAVQSKRKVIANNLQLSRSQRRRLGLS